MQEFEVVFLEVEVGGARVQGGVGGADRVGGRGPEDIVVVGEVGEEDAEEEACCCGCDDVLVWTMRSGRVVCL